MSQERQDYFQKNRLEQHHEQKATRHYPAEEGNV